MRDARGRKVWGEHAAVTFDPDGRESDGSGKAADGALHGGERAGGGKATGSAIRAISSGRLRAGGTLHHGPRRSS